MKTIIALFVILSASTTFAAFGTVILECKGTTGDISRLEIQDKNAEDGAMIEMHLKSGMIDHMYIQSSLTNIKKGDSDNIITASNVDLSPGASYYADAAFIRVLPGQGIAFIAYKGSVQKLSCKKPKLR